MVFRFNGLLTFFNADYFKQRALAATVTAEQADAARNVMAAARAHVRNLAPPGSVMALQTAPASPRLRGVLVER
jgi:hypothetical protein